MPLLSVPDLRAPLGTWAQCYGTNNLPVFPCTGKRPLTPNGFHDATCDPFQIEIWWRQWPDANIGTPMGHGRFALDIDPRAGGDDTLFALERQHGPLPHTLMSHTGGGGNHYIYLEPASGILNKAQVGQGIDVQGLGSYIILPPSIHPDTGKTYAWDVVDGPDDIEPQPAPDWLLALLTAGSSRQTAPAAHAPAAPIPAGSRDNALTAFAGGLRRAGASAAEIRAALDIRNLRCDVPLDAADLDRIARSIGRYDPPPQMLIGSAPHRTGNGTPAQGTTDPQAWGTAPYAFDFSAGISAEDLLKRMMVPPKFLIDKLIPDGLTLLAAPSKSYKSYFSLSLALATIGQGDWLDTFPVNESGNVVFFGLETHENELRNRMHQLRPSFTQGSGLHRLTFFSGMKSLPTFKNGLQQAIEQVIEHYTPRLIVIDPLSYLYRLGRQDDLASATLDLLWPLAEMASAAQIALLAPEHMRKRSKEDVSVVDQLAGSYIKAAIVHGMLLMHREGEDLIIETTMRNAASQEFAVSLTFDEAQRTLTWAYKGTMEIVGQTRQDSIKKKVIEELKARRYPMKVIDIIMHCGLVDTTNMKTNVRMILHRAESEGLVASSKRGEYYYIGQ